MNRNAHYNYSGDFAQASWWTEGGSNGWVSVSRNGAGAQTKTFLQFQTGSVRQNPNYNPADPRCQPNPACFCFPCKKGDPNCVPNCPPPDPSCAIPPPVEICAPEFFTYTYGWGNIPNADFTISPPVNPTIAHVNTNTNGNPNITVYTDTNDPNGVGPGGGCIDVSWKRIANAWARTSAVTEWHFGNITVHANYHNTSSQASVIGTALGGSVGGQSWGELGSGRSNETCIAQGTDSCAPVPPPNP
ncbi:MAG: hypothetical protein EXR72_21425 [Myxococcales bacterium]|nr:hypothetical protein [Myxococcales bacterium]